MAIIKAVRDGKDLRRVIAYVLRHGNVPPELVGGWNVDPEHAADQMMTTKQANGKMGGRAYKHYVQSFHPDDEITEAEAQEIAAELVARFPLFAGYEVLYVTHNDKGHIHTHIIVNSVAIEKKKPKINCPPSALQDLKDLSDKIAQAHGYRMEQERSETENVTTWDRDLYQVLVDAHAGRCQSWMYDAAVAVQSAMAEAADLNTFIRRLQDNGYGVRWGARTTTYITPGGKRVRADRLEEIFKLPSIRERYGDRQADQEQLRDALHNVQSRSNGPMEHEGPAIDYAEFAIDLENPDTRSYTDEEIDRHLYEAACAVCRQLRNAQTAEEFYQRMREGGYRVRYDKPRREYWIRTPYDGNEIAASTLERYYGLPSIRQAIIQLHRRSRRQPPRWDGRIWPEYTERTSDRTWDELLSTRRRNGHRRVSSGTAAYLPGGRRRPIEDRCAQMHTYIYPDSPMWDYELHAAALVLGQGVCDPPSLTETLQEHGYQLRTNQSVTYLLTPRGRRIVIDENPPQPVPEIGPFRRGVIAEFAGAYMEVLDDYVLSRRNRRDADPTALIGLAVGAVLGAASLIELVARLIGHGVRAVRRHRRQKKAYSIVTGKASITLEKALKDAGVKVQFQEKVPTGAEPEKAATPDQSPVESAPPLQKTRPERQQDMEKLLSIVQQASVATDRESFIELLAQQGCDVRWTDRGTLTFILPDGQKIRSSKLEKTYHLPSISAAYGKERTPPKSGPRVEAARLIDTTASTANSRESFDAMLTDAGYQIEWKSDGSDATIVHPNGQHMRLSSLITTFKIQPMEVLSGVQTSTIPESGTETGDEIDRLRDAIAAADRSLEAAAAGSVARGDGRDHQRTGSADQNPAARKQRAKREKNRTNQSVSVDAERAKKSRRSSPER